MLQTSTLIPFAVLLVVLGWAVRSDIRERRVTNRTTGILFLLGLVESAVYFGVLEGTGRALIGVCLGLAVWLPMYALRLLGAGDVKMFAAGAAWLGWKATLVAAFATGLAGGVLGVVWLLWHRGAGAVAEALAVAFRAPNLLQLTPMRAEERVPYAIAIAAGLLVGWWWNVVGGG